MLTATVKFTEDDMDILKIILDNHKQLLAERHGEFKMPPLALASALRDVDNITHALAAGTYTEQR